MASILVVDDSPQIREILRELLEKEGHRLCEAENGVEALRLFREDPVDLVITDVLMPEKDGIETIIELWRDYPDVRVIAISGGGDEVDPQYCLGHAQAFGALRCVAKPFSLRDILDAVAEVLQAQPV